MEKVMARFLYPDHGTRFDIQKVQEAGLEKGKDYEVREIFMGQSRTSIFLEGLEGPFNSVQFEFFEDGKPLNIFRDSRFNPYLGGK